MSIDMNRPGIPDELFSKDFNTDRLSELWSDICDELSDTRFTSRSHNAGTYEQGCRGPVCRKANREHYRRKAKGGVFVRPDADRIYDPVIEYFHTVIKYRIHAAQQKLLNELKGTG